ncbi:MAG: helix-turn-helix domain-containing protein [Gammaproteobacteria bacterium]|nr:MAG: helix-turn-helix domain-containing protein [Gammaproteobacteria bacterium]
MVDHVEPGGVGAGELWRAARADERTALPRSARLRGRHRRNPARGTTDRRDDHALPARSGRDSGAPDRHLHRQLHPVPRRADEGAALLRQLVSLPGFSRGVSELRGERRSPVPRPRSGSDSQPHPPLSETVAEPRVRRALLLMEQNLARPIAVAAVAAELGLSARQLERLCRQHVGMGPASLYRQLRMRYANWLIENTDRSVTDIANEAGFADCAHFSRQFKDTYGLSPSTRRLQPQRRIDGDAARARVFE